MKFLLEYDMQKRGLPTLFRWQYFTVDSKYRSNWDYSNLSQYLTGYRLTVSDAVLNQYKEDPVVSDLLRDLATSESIFVVSNNQAERYQDNKQYIKCRIPMYVLSVFKNLFISTLVYNAAQQKIPQGESISFLFDTTTRTVCINDLTLYQPVNDPYFRYARNAVTTLSVEAIGLQQYSDCSNDKLHDFYDRSRMSGWKERAKLENDHGIQNKAGIYMLYDANNNELYVGKAINLQTRIKQHGDKPEDPAYQFTHYRYSVISSEYYELLYLIENAAIHDLAWLVDMPKAEHYKPSLSKKFLLTDCKLVNRVEHQTKRQN